MIRPVSPVPASEYHGRRAFVCLDTSLSVEKDPREYTVNAHLFEDHMGRGLQHKPTSKSTWLSIFNRCCFTRTPRCM
ncbi:hypothetical protein CONPUDRAFT_79721, partial [Coniophora puteana RWD-64-598 SS2]